MAVSQQVSCNVLRHYSLSFILSLVSYNYLHFLPFYAHPNRLYNSCQAFHLKFLIAFRQWNKSSYSSLATDVIRFLQRHDCFVPIPNSLQWTTAAKLQKHIKITTWKWKRYERPWYNTCTGYINSSFQGILSHYHPLYMVSQGFRHDRPFAALKWYNCTEFWRQCITFRNNLLRTYPSSTYNYNITSRKLVLLPSYGAANERNWCTPYNKPRSARWVKSKKDTTCISKTTEPPSIKYGEFNFCRRESNKTPIVHEVEAQLHQVSQKLPIIQKVT